MAWNDAPPTKKEIEQAHLRWMEAPPSPEELRSVGRPVGEKVYDQPAGPEQAGLLDRAKERLADPKRWQAIAFGTGPYKQNSVQGTPPLAIPAGPLLKGGKFAVELATEGPAVASAPEWFAKGVETVNKYAAGRTAASAIQGGASAFASGDKDLSTRLSDAKSGAKTAAMIQAGVESIPYVGKAIKYGGIKLGSAISGVADDLIRNYAEKTDKINQIIKESGGEMPAAADQLRTELANGIQKTKQALTNQISKTLESAPKGKTIDINPILTPLEQQRVNLLSNNQIEEAKQIESIIQKIKNFGVDGDAVYGVKQYVGRVSLQGLNNIKQMLQDIATPAYGQPGQIFNYAKASQRAAKIGASIARRSLNEVSPEIAAANNQLSALHTIEDNLNRNLIASGKPDAALFAAGSGANPRNAKMLERLGNITGVDALGRAKDLATARAFNNPSLLPTDATGKAAARMFIASGIGSAVAGPLGLLAGGLASPAAIKAGVNVGSLVQPILSKAAGWSKIVRENPVAAQSIISLFGNQIRDANREEKDIHVSPETEEFFKNNPRLLDNITDPKIRAKIQEKINRVPSQSTAIQRRMERSK